MIVVNTEKCVGCGLCAGICHEQCIILVDKDSGKVAQVDTALCSTCTQCVAICPQQALSSNHIPPVAYNQRRLPAAAQLDELFKQRRTVRHFKPDKIDRALIEEVVSYGSYAPTNNYDLRAIVVDDPTLMEALDAVMTKTTFWIYNLFYKPKLVFNLIKILTPLVNLKHKVKIARGVEKGRTFNTLPAALVFIIGNRGILLSEVSANYALYNIILYAQTKGIGSRINAAGPIVLDRSKTTRKHLGLKKREHILAMLELGYPAVKFKNKVEGKAMRIQYS